MRSVREKLVEIVSGYVVEGEPGGAPELRVEILKGFLPDLGRPKAKP
jgi:hypothetical protein